ncbi:MAG: nucleotidyltransferase [Bacilli bacterium]|nr:nucleotidyltransferase [Bacilli bacterium]
MAVGIIAEYNPFHNGHLYHLKKIKEKFPEEEIVLVMNGHYTQRGTVSIIDKWKKVEIAKKAGINLIVELPFPFATQSADFFSYGAITILEKLKIEKFVFGSETEDIKTLTTIAKCQINNKEFDCLVKLYSKYGENYPTAISKAIYDLTGEKVNAPNDLLGVSYIKVILANKYKIKPIAIKRLNNYHDKNISTIASATAIRENLLLNKDVTKAIPNFTNIHLKKENLHFIEQYFNLLKYKIITEENLNQIATVEEGIENLLKKTIYEVSSYQELIEELKSKRYTYNKITRMLLHILMGFTKEEAKNFREITYIRILGFDKKGQKYLRKIKKNVEIPIISKFIRNNKMLELELKATTIYAIPNNEKELIKKEYTNHLQNEK